MNILSVVFISLSAISLILYLISLLRKIELLRIISSCTLQLFCGGIAAAFLKNYLTDSLNILIVTVISFIFSTAGELLLNFESKKICRVTGRIMFLLSVFCWIQLYKSTFYLYHVPVWADIAAFSIYLCIFFFVIVLCRFSKPKSYFLILISVAATAFFHYCTLLTLCFCPGADSIVLTCGSTILLGGEIFYIIQYLKYNFKYAGILRNVLIIISQAAIAAASVLMIAL